MEARIGHVSDSRDTRTAWEFAYRKFSDVRESHLRIQADSYESAEQALQKHLGTNQFAIIRVHSR